jgi:hypothetical protein
MTSDPMSPMYIPHVSESLSIVELWPNYGLPPGLPSESRYGSGEIVQGIISACDV